MAEEKTPVDKNVVSDEQDNLVDWDGPDDAANPMNWSPVRKWTLIALISFNTFNV